MRHRALRSQDRLLAGLIIGLSLFGLAMLLSASGPVAFQQYSDPLHFVRRQVLLGLLPGAMAFFILSRLDYRFLRTFAFPALVGSLILLVLVFIPGFGLKFGGSHSWLSLGSFSIQPSEFVKVAFLVYAAAWLSSRGETEGKTLQGSVSFLGALGAVVLLLVLQPDTGSMSVIAATSLLMYFMSGAPIVWFVTLGAAAAAGLFLLIKLTPYRAARFMTFLHPELDPQGVGYHINQAVLAVGSGGLFGLGYGQSRQKFLYLPEVQGDSIFAVLAEELGFVVTVLFLVAVVALVWRCFTIAREAPDRFGTYLAAGVGIWIGIQTFVNAASMIGLMPITGVTLPFVSYGNSATVSLFAALGIVASISRQTGRGPHYPLYMRAFLFSRGGTLRPGPSHLAIPPGRRRLGRRLHRRPGRRSGCFAHPVYRASAGLPGRLEQPPGRPESRDRHDVVRLSGLSVRNGRRDASHSDARALPVTRSSLPRRRMPLIRL